MNIAIFFPRFTGPYGGERLVLNLAKGLSEYNNSITIFTHSYKLIDTSHTKNIKIIEGVYPSVKNHQLATILDLVLMPLLMNKIKEKYDILLPIGWQSIFGTYLYKICKVHDQKVIYYCLEPPRLAYDLKKETIDKSKTIYKKIILYLVINIVTFIDKISIRSINNILSISDWTHDQVKKIYGRESKVITPGVEINRFNKYSKGEARKKLKISSKQKVFLSVSKLHFRKRIDLAINIFAKSTIKNSVFFIVGDGPDRKDIEKKIVNSNTSNIKLLGKLTDEEVALYMKASDYFIFTAQNEPFGMAQLEAAISGCTIIPYPPKYKPRDWKSTAEEHIHYYKKILT